MNRFEVHYYCGRHREPEVIETTKGIKQILIEKGREWAGGWIKYHNEHLKSDGYSYGTASSWLGPIIVIEVVDLNHPVHKRMNRFALKSA